MDEKIQQVLNDQEFVKELLALDSAEAVQAKLAEKDLKLSLDEVKLAQEMIVKKLESGSELSEDDLETVAGGVVAETVAAAAAVAACVIAVVAAIPSFIDSIRTHRW